MDFIRQNRWSALGQRAGLFPPGNLSGDRVQRQWADIGHHTLFLSRHNGGRLRTARAAHGNSHLSAIAQGQNRRRSTP